jgi:hypothetical protein
MKKYGTYGNLNLSVLGFVLQMRVLIFSPNFVRVLLGWDGFGVTSFWGKPSMLRKLYAGP